MDRLLNKVMEFISRNEAVDADRAEIIKYGLEIMILKIIFFLAVVIVGILMNSFWESLIFMMVFIPVRSFAGGYHADTRRKCFIESMLTVISAIGIIKICINGCLAEKANPQKDITVQLK